MKPKTKEKLAIALAISLVVALCGVMVFVAVSIVDNEMSPLPQLGGTPKLLTEENETIITDLHGKEVVVEEMSTNV